MIGTLLRINWLNLKRDRVAQGLTFVLPIIFFSIFAYIFGSQGGGDATAKVKIAVVDEDRSEASRRLSQELVNSKSLRVQTQSAAPGGPALDRAEAMALVKDGKLPVVVILPAGFGESFGDFSGGGPPIELFADQADPVAPQMVAGLLQGAAMTAAPDLMITRGLEMFEKFAGGMTPAQRAAMDYFLPRLRESAASRPADAATPSDGRMEIAAFSGPVHVKVVDVANQDRKQKKKSPAIAFYAAGTAVMFLLFSASAAGGSLLEEQEAGALERLLSSKVTMPTLLLGKWLFIAIIGAMQVALMFIWGSFVFGLDLWTPQHLAGFVAMTVVTAAAASAFGLVLATACRSRAQLGGVSTIVILIMSAVGGSMFPRFLMPEGMKTVGLATFNAWALDGYQKVFWYDKTVPELWPQLIVLVGLAIVFMLVARALARRWETV